MTIIAGGTIATTVVGGAAVPSLIGIATGVGVSSLGKVVGSGTCSTVSGAIGASASAGTIFGTAFSGTLAGGLVSGVTGALSSGVVGTTTSLFAGPIGLLVLGIEVDEVSKNATFDCWKPLLHDESTEPSRGMLLRDVVGDERIKNVDVRVSNGFPEITLENVWNEKFLIQYVALPTEEVFAHALNLC